MARSLQEAVLAPYFHRDDWNLFSETVTMNIADTLNLYFRESEGEGSFANAFYRLFPTSGQPNNSYPVAPENPTINPHLPEYSRYALVGIIKKEFPEYSPHAMALLHYLGASYMKKLLSKE